MDSIRNEKLDSNFDWQTLIHPASAYGHPRAVLADPDLTDYEKRAILSSWASDICAVPNMPGLRHPPGAAAPVTFDEIIDALRSLDDDPLPRGGGKAARQPRPFKHWLRVRRTRDGDGGMEQAA